MAVEFQVLGSIQARVDGRLMELGHARQRLLLAALVVDVNREVSTDELADRIWGQEHAQRGTLYGYLSRLRKVLAAAEGVEIARRPGGYVLTADPAMVDLFRFRELAAQARTVEDGAQAVELFGQALSLWRGQALAGADTPWADAVREGLRQKRLAVELDRAEVRLRLGQHTELVANLQAQAKEHPWDERLAAQLMLALYRCGRTDQALGHYQHIHQILARELGLKPGPELRRLHQQILTGDPTLTPAPRAGVGSAQALSAVPVPRQLPAPPALFTGRSLELDRLSAALEEHAEGGGTVVISAIGGVGGIGKTYLAVHWAHQHAGHFPQGQLFVNLRGFDPAAEPVDPSVVVRGFLEALGVTPSAIPADPDAQSALYRSLMAGRRMLIVLDNARDATQILPLLPGSPTCTVLVTSRHQLTSLTATHAAQPLPLDALPETEARALLARHLGQARLDAEPQAVTALLGHCAGLPLALSIVAARATTHPDLPLTHLAEELAATETRLDALDAGELTASLRAVFATSYQTLSPEAARAFALLGLAPGADISLHAAASLIGQTTARTRTLLRTLENAHLVHQHLPGRYRMHDLVHLYATEHAHTNLAEHDHTAALRQLVDFYLHTAHHASLLLDPQPLLPLELEPPTTGCVPHKLADRTAAWTWYAAERSCLPALQQRTAELGWHIPTWQLAHALFSFHRNRFDSHKAVAMGRAGLAAAGQLADPRPKATAHSLLGFAYAQNLHSAEALDHLGQALPVFEQTGDLPGQAFAHYSFCATEAWAHEGRDPRRGLHHGERARQLYHALGNPWGESLSLNHMGLFHTLLDEHQQARACGEQALTLARGLGNPDGEGYALLQLGFAVHRSGQYTQALTYHHQALTVFRGSDQYWEAVTLETLGHTHRALGQHAEAHHAWSHAHHLYRTWHRTTDAERLHRRLNTLDDTPTSW